MPADPHYEATVLRQFDAFLDAFDPAGAQWNPAALRAIDALAATVGAQPLSSFARLLDDRSRVLDAELRASWQAFFAALATTAAEAAPAAPSTDALQLLVQLPILLAAEYSADVKAGLATATVTAPSALAPSNLPPAPAMTAATPITVAAMSTLSWAARAQHDGQLDARLSAEAWTLAPLALRAVWRSRTAEEERWHRIGAMEDAVPQRVAIPVALARVAAEHVEGPQFSREERERARTLVDPAVELAAAEQRGTSDLATAPDGVPPIIGVRVLPARGARAPSRAGSAAPADPTALAAHDDEPWTLPGELNGPEEQQRVAAFRRDHFDRMSEEPTERAAQLRTLLVNLLARDSTLTAYDKAIERSKQDAAYYGVDWRPDLAHQQALRSGSVAAYGVQDIRNRQIGMTASELGRALLASGMARQDSPDPLVAELARLGSSDWSHLPGDTDVQRYNQRIAAGAIESAAIALGYLAVRDDPRLDAARRGILEHKIERDLGSSQGATAKVNDFLVQLQLPVIPPALVERGRSMTFRIRLGTDRTVRDLAITVQEGSGPQRSLLTAPLADVLPRPFDGRCTLAPPSLVTDEVSHAILVQLGLDHQRAFAVSDDRRGGGMNALVEAAVERLQRGTTDVVTIAGDRLGGWVAACGNSFDDDAMAGLAHSPFPRTTLDALAPGRGVGDGGMGH